MRFVAFLQGCPLRCLYCHNPDTWDQNAGVQYEWTPRQLFDEMWRYRYFIVKGGVTLTGGEPLMQADFCREYFRLCRGAGIHTAFDTAGSLFNEKTLSVLDFTDLVLLDIKALNSELCRKVSGCDGRNALRLLDELEVRGIDVWIRHVIVPGLTDDNRLLDDMVEFLRSYTVVRKIEWLPYHEMGVFKYRDLGLDYPLEGTPPLSARRLQEIQERYQ
ncbi:MAG: pyruvate formate lyase-activating protein [Paraprevotella sp.]|nr:pyruvate formate lyase-activating protein [Paraprevotella sp.]